MIRSCLVTALCLAAGGGAAHPAMTAEDTTMRAAPSAHARAVQSIPANAQIDLGECREHWCAASWKNLEGWVRVESVAANSEPLVGAAPPPYAYAAPYGYYGGPVIVGPVFGYGYYRRW